MTMTTFGPAANKYLSRDWVVPQRNLPVVLFKRALTKRELDAVQGNPMRALGLLRPATPCGKKGKAGKKAAFAHQARTMRRAVASFRHVAEQPLNAKLKGGQT